MASMTTWEIVCNLFEGFYQNGLIFILTLIMAIPLGLVITFGSMSNFTPIKILPKFQPIKWVSKTFVWIIRGTPLMLQLFVVMYAPGMLFDIPIKSRMTAVLIAFVIDYAAYFSEIYRGGIESIAKGQYEAGQVLGMTKSQVFFKVILFQVIKRITPPMSNEIITLVKDTSLARIVGIAEIIMSAERFTKSGLIWPLFSTGIYFLLFNGILTLLFGYIEKKMSYYN